MGNLITETPYSEITATLECLDREGVGRDHLKNLRTSSNLRSCIAELVKLGYVPLPDTDIIEADTDPELWYSPMKVVEHKKGALQRWKASDVKFFQHDCQLREEGIRGYLLRGVMNTKPALNVIWLDFLLLRPHHIPESWQSKHRILFWGTIYREPKLFGRTDPPEGCHCVRGIEWNGKREGWRPTTSYIDDRVYKKDSWAAIHAG